MTPEQRAARRAAIKRDILITLEVVRENDERPIDEIDRELLDLCAEATTCVLFLDAQLKILGPLNPREVAVYQSACWGHDATLAALGIEKDPYGRPAS